MRSFQWRACFLLLIAISPANAEEPLDRAKQAAEGTAQVLTEAQFKDVRQSVDAALKWLAGQQQRDGRFFGPATGQPGITSLTVMAFLSAGHLPGAGPYGARLERAIDYALSCEIEDGLFCAEKARPVWALDQTSHTGTYNQAITALMFSEVFGELKGRLGEDVSAAVKRALDYSAKIQFRTVPGRPQDEGGWRYIIPNPEDRFVTDLSITAWQVTFLRSAKNAGFDVDTKVVKAAQKYVKGLYDAKQGTFTYDHARRSRGMTGAGIMAMAMLGRHRTKEVKAAAAWLRRHPFDRYGERIGHLDRFHYSVYYCTQAMYQLGGKDWQQFYPKTAELLVGNQRPDGSWRALSYEIPFGDAYATAMSVLSLTTSYALLPIHQR